MLYGDTHGDPDYEHGDCDGYDEGGDHGYGQDYCNCDDYADDDYAGDDYNDAADDDDAHNHADYADAVEYDDGYSVDEIIITMEPIGMMMILLVLLMIL